MVLCPAHSLKDSSKSLIVDSLAVSALDSALLSVWKYLLLS